MFTKKQMKPPSEKQLAYIRILEKKANMRFYGSTTREAIKFIERANQAIVDLAIIRNKLKREEERLNRNT